MSPVGTYDKTKNPAASSRAWKIISFLPWTPGSNHVAVAGGGLVDESALFRAPESETNAGAALDMFKGKPPRQGNPFLTLPNVVVTLHVAVAGWSEEALYRELREAGTEIKLVLEGKNRRHPLNPEVLFGS